MTTEAFYPFMIHGHRSQQNTNFKYDKAILKVNHDTYISCYMNGWVYSCN